MQALAPLLEREAIAPNYFGNFEDMLLAVYKHPAMLIYLNNEKSFGKDSKIGMRRKMGLNENLAREILELHTLGVNGPYSQQDVIALANGISGWSVSNPKENGSPFKYREFGHQPGKQVLLGYTFAQPGIEQGEQMIKMLANHPSTAHYVSYKLAKHFVSDKPNEQLVLSMEKAWLNSKGNMREVVKVMLMHEQSWQLTAQKFKTPRDFVFSSMRAMGLKKIDGRKLIGSLSQLGQTPFNAGSPAGYEDEEAFWNNGNALVRRIEWSTQVSKRFSRKAKPEQLIDRLYAKQYPMQEYDQVVRAGSRKKRWLCC